MIDHSTCGHLNHTTLDGSRHEEMHSAIFELIQEWSHRRNARQHHGLPNHKLIDDCIDDLVKAMHPFEIEQ